MATAGCIVALVPGCASTAGSISVEQLPVEPAPAVNEYTIGVGDTLNVQVYEQEKMSGTVRVRTDGKITLLLLNDLQAAGKTPVGLAGDIEASLKALVLTPRVTVVVAESSPLTISVLGEVANAGSKTLPRDAGVALALAAAGGLSTFAHKDRIYVTRPGLPERIRFSYGELLRGIGRGPSFRLRLGDVIVVE